MNSILFFSKSISISFILLLIVIFQTGAQYFNEYGEQDVEEDIQNLNKSLSNILSTEKLNLTDSQSSSSTILNVLSTTYSTLLTTINNNTTLASSENHSALKTSSSTISPIRDDLSMTTAPYALINYIVDQINQYRNLDILSHIKQCDPNMKLSDMCENYSFNNYTNSLVRESNVTFQSLQHIYDVIVDQFIIQKLNDACPVAEWCLENLTESNIRFTVDVLRQLGNSFCLLEQCQHRLQIYISSCPSISTQNISRPTLALLPMLCTLYKEQDYWSSSECINQIVYLLHMLYAFWPQLETCHRVISAGSDGCTPECLTFDAIFHKVENQCKSEVSFLTRVPTLAWYRLIDLQQACHQTEVLTKSPFISSVQNFISSNVVWYQFHQRPVHAALFIVVIVSVVIGFSLCLYFMAKNDHDSNTRHLDDDYEYTRLHESALELGTTSETLNTNVTSNGMMQESQFGLNSIHHLSEHQRLL